MFPSPGNPKLGLQEDAGDRNGWAMARKCTRILFDVLDVCLDLKMVEVEDVI